MTQINERPEAAGGVGGLDDLLAKINADKKVARLMGADDEGKKNVDFPAWFDRRGLRTFSVDTGLGKVLCRVPRTTIEGKVEDIPEDQIIPLIVRSLVTIPATWKAEETMRFGANGPEVTEGSPLPAPTTFHAAPVDQQKDYLACLPKSLQVQVWIGLSYMALAPLPSDPQPSA